MGSSLRRLREVFVRGLYRSKLPYLGYDLMQAVTLPISSRFNLGTNVFEREWDALLVLDACRVDALREVASEYEFIEEVGSIRSVGSATAEWVANTFIEKYRDQIAGTALVASHGAGHWVLSDDSPAIYNAAANRVVSKSAIGQVTHWDVVDTSDFLLVDPIYEYALDNPLSGLTRPETVTDRAIAVGREADWDRLIVHYKPPHAPYTAKALQEDRSLYYHEESPWKALRNGESREKVWESYLDELRWGLDSIAPLLENLDADRVVITADHGEAFGEWGIYSHPIGVPHPVLTRVPWVETSAVDTGTVEPEVDTEASTEESVRNQLEKLGYV